MKAPWLAELKPGEVFYTLERQGFGLMLQKWLTDEVMDDEVMARDESGYLVGWNTWADYRGLRPIRATPAAHAAYDALKRLWDECKAD